MRILVAITGLARNWLSMGIVCGRRVWTAFGEGRLVVSGADTALRRQTVLRILTVSVHAVYAPRALVDLDIRTYLAYVS